MNNDLISRPPLLKTYKNWLPQLTKPEDAGDRTGVETCIAVLEDAPAVDAVEVVRCKDCKHRGIVRECPMCYTEDSYDEDYGFDYWDVDKTVDEGFCHCGEKMDAEVEG